MKSEISVFTGLNYRTRINCMTCSLLQANGPGKLTNPENLQIFDLVRFSRTLVKI